MRIKAKPRFMQRGTQAIIAAGARKRKKIRVSYTKVTTGETVQRVLEPYSYRYEKSSLGPGRWKYLYAYHGTHRRIEKYLVRNIHSAVVVREPYVPRWKVEIV